MERTHAEQQQVSSHYRPCLQDGRVEQGGFDDSVPTVDIMSVDQREAMRDMDYSQLVGAPEASVTAKEDVSVPQVEMLMMMKKTMEVKPVETMVAKRKRGRPPGGLAKTNKTTPLVRKKKDEEDVCFICFDGGTLVLCDRRGCPKAYHPACIKRDESFFKSRAKWNCGWHICSSCQKAAHYMCYTCTYSLCKGCIKDADYLSVRGNNGFCGMCMRTVMLIENFEGNTEVARVDFDDKSSWEYLFKMYWIFLKGKLSLTLDELTRAKNPWKGAYSIAYKGGSSGELYDGIDDKVSSGDNSCAGLQTNNPKKRKAIEQTIFNKDSLTMEKTGCDKDPHLPEGTIWASKELLEFVAHMKNGDTSVLSQFDVQALLLEYVRKNNLRDPHRKCQIVCDLRLLSLFGKARIRHFEMLKLLESHFLIKESSSADDILRVGVVDDIPSQLEADGRYDNQLPIGSDKGHNTHKKADDRGSQTNADAFAAIDVHNINLIYLRRNLLESFMDDADKFHDKVVGSIVRIRIPNNDKKQETYRLVQVAGTSKVAKPYKLGERNADVMLEILNLETKEVISIDGISNQDFCEDECKRLHQSIKCGLIKRLTVGEIQEKAMTLQAVRVNDVLETEIIGLNQLHDWASEKGHEKEFRECVEKLQLLNSPEERQRRLFEICEVHIDPKMDPSYDSEDDVGELDEKKQDDNVRTKLSGYARKESDPFSARRAGDVSNDSKTGAQKNLTKSCKRTGKAGITSSPDKGGATWFHEIMNGSSWKKKEASGLNNLDTPANQINTSGSLTIVCNSQAVVKSELFSGVAAEISPLALSTQADESANNFETDKIWHYLDPNGIIQGPFSMLQLRKWNTIGHFPPDLRIWRINEKLDKSVLLNDALSGKYHEAKMVPDNSNLPSQDLGVATDDRDNNGYGGLSASTNTSQIDNKKEGSWEPVQNDPSGNDGLFRSDERVSSSSSWTTPADVTNTNERKNGSFEPGWDSSKGNSSWPDQPQACGSSLVPPAFSGKSFGSVSYPVREVYGGECTSGQENGNCNSQSTADSQFKSEQGFEHRFDSEGHSGQSSGQSWRPPPVNVSSSDWVSSSGFISLVKSLKTTEETQEIDFQGPSNPTPKQSNEDLEVQAPEYKGAASSVPVQDAGPSRSTASSLVGGGGKVSEVTDELGGYSSTPAKPSIGDWGSSIVSASSLKPTEIVHAATPTSINDQLTHSSPSHPTSNASSWQAIVTEPTEFCSLVDESVSDLLAEAEATESLDGLPSPTSIMKCRDVLTQDSKHDCISPLDEFSPGLDPGRSDALSSTGDLQAPSQSTVTDERDDICRADVIDPEKRSSMHSSSSFEVEGDAKPADISVNQWEARSEIQPTPPSAASRDISTTQMSWRVGLESRTTSWRGVQGSANVGRGALDQRNTNMGWGSVQMATQDGISMNFGASAGNPGFPKLRSSGDRFSGPRDWGFQSRDVGYGRGRGTWNRQPFFVGGNESSFRPSKSHRICKFYERGYCKKGASCNYLHP
ncbi:zinc finger CCCH domain-containing protein 44-like isoform X1 [Carya illinoinensis]|uniref:Zinc finger CCCH domain-containing protein 44 n=1 Tax=Carya illinoinensis TaxID=32201 RepID=A0A8T1PRG0_CARIL|nr:zinc finger CCCH domain-containing protein 44-like isoform X1 [Carya illinoinensis]KAG6645635.1 hypothetical protein CIPAW_08G135700 [Carya illinoinensis]